MNAYTHGLNNKETNNKETNLLQPLSVLSKGASLFLNS